MDAHRWLDQVRAKLARKNLPPLYSERLLSELSDHVTDFLEDPMSTDATKDLGGLARQLGVPSHIASAAVRERRQAHFGGRHPLLSFVVLPVILLPMMWAASIVAVLLVAKLLGFESGRAPSPVMDQWGQWTVPGVTFASLALPIALCATLMCWLARRTAVNRKWLIAGCSLVAVIGGAAMVQMVLPGVDHQGSLSFGFGLKMIPSPAQVVQFALPNFYFHVVTAYSIMRHVGVPLGKMDYIGPIAIKS